jgi:hypothetical protein
MSSNANSEVSRSDASVVKEYIFDVRIVAVDENGTTVYSFEAPEHREITFADQELAELYADVYFDVNGFEEEGTGERGIPPEIVQGGRDTMAAYLLTQYADDDFVASFYGVTPGKVHQYVEWVRTRAEEVRENAVTEGIV